MKKYRHFNGKQREQALIEKDDKRTVFSSLKTDDISKTQAVKDDV